MTTYKIVFRSGILTGTEEQFTDEDISIGRDPNCNLHVDDLQVSKNHLKIIIKNNELLLEDLNSTNGSFVNGKRVSDNLKLKNGDLVSFGDNNVFEVQKTDEQLDEEFVIQAGIEEQTSSVNEISPIPENIKTDKTKINTQKESLPKPKTGRKFLSSLPTWAMVLFVAIGFFILFCLIPFVVVEVTNQWCNLFSGFFNAISPGLCP